MAVLGLIGGTGLPSIDHWVSARSKSVATPYGEAGVVVAVGEKNGRTIVFLPRHGENHGVPPHKINYRANLWALHSLGVTEIVAVSAVGGIDADTSPRTIVFPHQIIDYTYGREHTFFEGGELNHIDFTEPYTTALRSRLMQAAEMTNISFVKNGVYGATQGPRLETAAEIDKMAREGCTLVGMTGMPEASLARELGMDYACCALVVNWAAGRTPGIIEMAEILENVDSAQKKLRSILDVFFDD